MRNVAIALLLLLFGCVTAAHAREQLPAKAVISFGDTVSTEHTDGVKFNANSTTEAERIAVFRSRIEDMHAMGVRVMALGTKGGVNGVSQVTKMAAFSRAARDFNAANPSSKICIIPFFVSDAVGNGTTDGVLAMFDAADAGGTASALCESGGRPVVGVFAYNGTCINPLTALAPRAGSFTVFATQYNTTDNYLSSSCKATLTASGGTDFRSFLYASEKAEFATDAHMTAKKTAIEATGAQFVPGVGSAHSLSCGDGGGNKVNSNYVLTDLKFFNQLLEGWRLSISKSPNYVIITDSGPGDMRSGSYVTRSLICDANDKAIHNADSSGINHGFSCPNVPDYLRAALPSGYRDSFSLPHWSRPGFWRVTKLFTDWFLNNAEPETTQPFVAFSYRQHKWGLAGTWQVCPDATYVVSANSVGGVYQGDNIALTSWLATDTRVRVKLGGNTIYDGTLPAKQAKLTGGNNQTLVPIGNNVGAPIIEVLNADGTVATSKVGLLEITNTPKHFGGKTGRNPSLYADYIDVAATSTGGGTGDTGGSTGGAGIGTGIMLSTTGNIKNNLVRNIIGVGIATAENADNVDIVHNTVSGAKVGITISSSAGGTYGTSMVVASNIIVGADTGLSKSGTIGSDAIYSNNLFNGNTTNMLSSISSVAVGTVTGDPKFVSASDFNLQSTSPARDAGLQAYNPGIDILGRSRQSIPDIGAYEYIDTSSRSPCTASTVDPCEPGGASYPCSQLTKSLCVPVPTLTAPTNIVVGANGGTYNLAADQDAYVTGSEVITKTVNIVGGRTVHVKGLNIVLDWSTGALQNTRALNMVGMQQAYIEGVLLDANDRCDALTLAHTSDAVPYLNTDSKFTIVNSFIGNPNANRLDGACIGDCVQLQGEGRSGGVEFEAQNLTCMTKAEGLTLPDRQPGSTNSIKLTNVNVRPGANGIPRYDVAPDGGIFYYFWSANDDRTTSVVLNSVYSDWSKSNRNVSPGPATSTQQYIDFSDPNKVKFKNTNITGDILRGTPPVGDYAPRDMVGQNYNRSEFCTE